MDELVLRDNQTYVDFLDDNGNPIKPGTFIKIKGEKYNGRIVRYEKTVASEYGRHTPYINVGYRIYFTIGASSEFHSSVDYHGIDVLIANKKMVNSRVKKLIEKTRAAAYHTKEPGQNVALDFFELQMLS
jgi:hypothetical protein